ncbi:hypothetical protein [Lysobacter enzymogenes]|uniref:hypothetical protein n=1 Tax=Lysobacter enzymogenes TaxID=69 RepID=UPI0019CFB811|nr:hypothetical protein [Lysobacter enzymogenes]
MCDHIRAKRRVAVSFIKAVLRVQHETSRPQRNVIASAPLCSCSRSDVAMRSNARIAASSASSGCEALRRIRRLFQASRSAVVNFGCIKKTLPGASIRCARFDVSSPLIGE